MSEIETSFADSGPGTAVPPLSIREGLPPTYRMRADAHYVDELDTPAISSPVRLVDAKIIEARHEGPPPADAFVESIRRHGVLQPLIVQSRGGRYRLIAGHKRLAAALAAGLSDVPCLLHRVDEEQATVLAEAANVPAIEPPPAHSDAGAGPGAEAGVRELAESLAALASSANLLTGGSTLTHAVALDLVRAEAARALQLLTAHRVLRGQSPLVRLPVPVWHMVERCVRTTAPECRLRHLTLHLGVDEVRHHVLRGDEELLSHALAGCVMAVATIVPAGERVTVGATISPDGQITLTVSQHAVTVPSQWLAHAFEQAWPIGSGTSALVLLQAAERIVELHGGRAQAAALGTGAAVVLTLPETRRESAA
jgi:hypothetical protein